MLGLPARDQVGGRRHRDEPPVGPDTQGDHLMLDALAEPDTGIEPVFDDVPKPRIDAKFQSDFGIVAQDWAQFGPDQLRQRVMRQRDPHRSRGLVAQHHQRRDFFLDLGHPWRQRPAQPLLCLGGRDRARRARQQPHAHPRLEPLDAMTERRLHHAEPGRRPGEVAILGDGEKPHQIVEIGLRHGPTFMALVDKCKRCAASNQ